MFSKKKDKEKKQPRLTIQFDYNGAGNYVSNNILIDGPDGLYVVSGMIEVKKADVMKNGKAKVEKE